MLRVASAAGLLSRHHSAMSGDGRKRSGSKNPRKNPRPLTACQNCRWESWAFTDSGHTRCKKCQEVFVHAYVDSRSDADSGPGSVDDLAYSRPAGPGPPVPETEATAGHVAALLQQSACQELWPQLQKLRAKLQPSPADQVNILAQAVSTGHKKVKKAREKLEAIPGRIESLQKQLEAIVGSLPAAREEYEGAQKDLEEAQARLYEATRAPDRAPPVSQTPQLRQRLSQVELENRALREKLHDAVGPKLAGTWQDEAAQRRFGEPEWFTLQSPPAAKNPLQESPVSFTAGKRPSPEPADVDAMVDDEGEDNGPKQEKRGRSSKEDEEALRPENLADRFRKEASECKAEANRALARALGVPVAGASGGDPGLAGDQ